MKNKMDGTGYPDKRFAQTYKGLMAVNLFFSIIFLVISLYTLYNPLTTLTGDIDTSKNTMYLISIYFFFLFLVKQIYKLSYLDKKEDVLNSHVRIEPFGKVQRIWIKDEKQRSCILRTDNNEDFYAELEKRLCEVSQSDFIIVNRVLPFWDKLVSVFFIIIAIGLLGCTAVINRNAMPVVALPFLMIWIPSFLHLFVRNGDIINGKISFKKVGLNSPSAVLLSDVTSYERINQTDNTFVYHLNLSNGKHIKISVRAEDAERFNKLMDKRFEEKG